MFCSATFREPTFRRPTFRRPTFRSVTTGLAFAAALCGGAFDSHAQGMSGGMSGGGMMGFSTGGPGPFVQFGCFMVAGENGAFASVTERMEFIRSSLGLTPQQMPAWNNFANALTASLQSQQEAYQVMMNSIMSMNFAERFGQQLNAMNTHLIRLQQVMPALSAFYAVLTPEQQAKADALFRSMGCFR